MPSFSRCAAQMARRAEALGRVVLEHGQQGLGQAVLAHVGQGRAVDDDSAVSPALSSS